MKGFRQLRTALSALARSGHPRPVSLGENPNAVIRYCFGTESARSDQCGRSSESRGEYAFRLQRRECEVRIAGYGRHVDRAGGFSIEANARHAETQAQQTQR